MAQQPQQDDEVDSDPTRLILPHVQTDMRWIGDATRDELLVFAPAIIVGLGGAAALFNRNPLAPAVLILALALGGVGAWVNLSTPEWTTPTGRVKEWLQYRRLSLRLPFGPGEDIDKTHGIERLAADGSVVCRDGRRVALLPVSGTNTDRLSDREEEALVGELTTAIDEEIKDIPWSFYSQSRQASSEMLAEHREARAREGRRTGMSKLEQRILQESADWLREEDKRWEANEWHHYIEVPVRPGETPSVPLSEQLRSAVPGLSPQRNEDAEPRKAAAEILTERVETVQDALSEVSGLSVRRASPRELATVGLLYWHSSSHTPSASLLETFSETRSDELSPAERAFSPGNFGVSGAVVELEERYARTFWISEWPMEPAAMFLEDIYALDGVDLDVKINAEPMDARAVQDMLDEEVGELGVEEGERAKRSDLKARTIRSKRDAYENMFLALQWTTAQPWSISGYVTVRADTRKELLDVAEDVQGFLESTPADTWPVASGTRQQAAFASAAPFGRDQFADDTENQMRRLCLGGALGGMFPFGVPRIDEPGGIRWGRNTLGGESIVASPFSRGMAPHMFTIGASGSGKTHSTSGEHIEWYLDREDRTLIVCDTQGEFEGLTKALGGKHIVVDGSDGINPLDIRPVPEHVRESTDGGYDGLRAKKDEAKQFIAGILNAQGIDPAEYVSLIEDGLKIAYQEAGITQDRSTHSKPSPTMADFIDALSGMSKHPEEYTFTDEGPEVKDKGKTAGKLLNKLGGFHEGGKYAHLMGETETGLGPDTDMAYLDLRQQQEVGDADRSVMLHLMLSQVSQLIKQTQGETIFVVDEAHHLLHSEGMVKWLQQQAREWRRFDAAMHLISQSPEEFVKRMDSVEAGQENHRQAMVEQRAITQVFASPKTDPETLRMIGLDNDDLIETAKTGLRTGETEDNEFADGRVDVMDDGRDDDEAYTEALVQFSDRRGWLSTHYETAPIIDRILQFDSRIHDSFEAVVNGEEPIDPEAAADEGEQNVWAGENHPGRHARRGTIGGNDD